MPHPVRWTRVTAAIVLALSGAVAAFGTIAPSTDAELLVTKASIVEPLAIDFAPAPIAPTERYVREERLQRGDTLASLLSRIGVRASDVAALTQSGVLRRLKPQTTVTAELEGSGALLSMSFLIGTDLFRVEPGSNGFVVNPVPGVLETRTAFRANTVNSSLFAAADAADVPEAVAVQLADIFGGEIDFHRDLRKGDRFAVVYEIHSLNGQQVRTGRVIAAEFVNNGRAHRALWYPGADGKGAYYTPSGKNLRKAFLRSPLEFSRISSGFGSRMHPFLQTWRSHKGVDYAAPSGTRIRAVADGVVDFAGSKGGYGNVVVIRHNGQYATLYGHMSRFAPGLTRGTRVGQGSVIGFVGRSGWATGPHLHYEFHVGGEARNPLTIALPAAQPLSSRELAQFQGHAQPYVAQLDLLGNARLARAD